MIIYLPVQVYNKCTNLPFNVEFNNDTLIINTTNNININVHNIILCNFSYGITTLPISFPITFFIVKNELICDQFYIFKTLSHQNDFDFLNIIINEINKKYNKKLTLPINLNLMNLINVLKLHSNNDTTPDEDNNKIYYRVCRYLNFCLAFISGENTTNISNTSKIIQIINLIKLIKINYYGNILTIEEHIEFIKNPTLIKKKRNYFCDINNKTVKILVGDNIRTNYDNIKPYPIKYYNLISIKNLLNILILNHFTTLFDISCRVLYKKKPNIINLMNNYILNITDDISKKSFDEFKMIINDNNYELILNELMSSQLYPLNYDKRTINDIFIKILYICIKNENLIQTLNNKTKSLIIYLVKLYKSIESNDISILYNPKIYTENMIYQITKIMLLNDTYKLITNNNTIIQKFITNICLIQILSNLSWKTISKQLTIFKYFISNKATCKQLFFIDGKLNKSFTHNMDNRIKKIIIEPLGMFNYLKNEDDFYKWIYNFKEDIPKIFYNMINLNNSDYKTLAKILYYYSKIQHQSLNDEFYRKLLGVLKMNSSIILFNDRINIKLKDIFKNININLGYLARDIINEESISVTITDDIDEDNDVYDTITKLKRKYYKYKGKYLEMKMSETIK
jgi:hypothetical protein